MMTPNVAERFADTSVQERTVLLEVKHLHVDYETASTPVHAVNDVSFTLHRGQILGLAGESGSGKSTLAYAITRLLRAPAKVSGGEIWYYPKSDRSFVAEIEAQNHMHLPWQKRKAVGKDNVYSSINVLALSPAELKAFRWQELAIVFQSAMNALNPVLRLETQITDVLAAHMPSMDAEARHQRALELLHLVGITPDRLRSYPHELSGGMRQRAIIAIALALNPGIIIMDEPTTALDVVVQRDILVELLALRERLDFAVIFITHDLSLLLEIADQVAIMYAGRIVETASWQELYHHPRHPYTLGLLNSFPSLHGPKKRMSGIPGSPPDLRDVPSGCAFRPRCSFAFDECCERVPVLAVPQVERSNIGLHSMDPGGKAVDGVLLPRSQKSRVACHMYNAKQLSVGMEKIPDLFSIEKEEDELAFLFITHDIAIARYFAEEMLVMYAGQMVEGGPTEEVIQQPQHPYTQLLLSAAPDPATMGHRHRGGEDTEESGNGSTTSTVRGEPPSLINPPGGCRFHPRCPSAMPECSQSRPARTNLGNGHWTHCFLYSKRAEAAGKDTVLA